MTRFILDIVSYLDEDKSTLITLIHLAQTKDPQNQLFYCFCR